MDYSSVPWMMHRGFQPAPPIKSDRVWWPWGIDAQVAYKRWLDEALRHQKQANAHITRQIRESQREELWSADFFLYNRWVKKFMQWGSVLVFALLIIHDDSCLVYYYEVLFQRHAFRSKCSFNSGVAWNNPLNNLYFIVNILLYQIWWEEWGCCVLLGSWLWLYCVRAALKSELSAGKTLDAETSPLRRASWWATIFLAQLLFSSQIQILLIRY